MGRLNLFNGLFNYVDAFLTMKKEKKIEDKEHYEAQIKYAFMLGEVIEITWFHPIKKIKAILKAEKFRDSHRKCCEWANEKD